MSIDSVPPRLGLAPDEVDLQISRVEERLVEDFAETVPPTLVSQHIREARATFDEARITQFVPTLIERAARRRLLELTRRG